jgi:hypothetical protein
MGSWRGCWSRVACGAAHPVQTVKRAVTPRVSSGSLVWTAASGWFVNTVHGQSGVAELAEDHRQRALSSIAA